jgi:hypothetical protein
MTGTAVESTTSVRDAELYQLIGQARELWVGCQKVYENHDKTVETYREMEERAMADFLDPTSSWKRRSPWCDRRRQKG